MCCSKDRVPKGSLGEYLDNTIAIQLVLNDELWYMVPIIKFLWEAVQEIQYNF